MSWVVSTLPSVEPITLEEAKLHLRVTQAADDMLITALIAAARVHVEQVCEHALMAQVWTMRADRFEGLTLPGGNVRSVTSISYLDSAGASQTLPLNQVVIDTTRVPARVTLAANQSWAVVAAQANAVSVVYEVGYSDAAAVPAPIKAAMLLIIGDLYENREAQSVGQPITENATVSALLWPFRRMYL